MRDIFSTALLRLTVVYVSVLTIVCLLFSGFIYTLASNEIDRSSRRQVVGFRNLLGRFIVDEQESELLRNNEADESRSRLRAKLTLGNLAVIGAGTVLSYFFAKKTLRPIEETVKTQERFTSDASHELRTPLATMRTEIEVALRDSKLTSKEARALLVSNLEEVATLQLMTENLLSLARNKELGEQKVTELSKLIRACVKQHYTKIRKAGMTIDEKYQSGIKVTINKEALRQVIAILVDNSLKYAGKSSKIEVSLSSTREKALLKISDNGVGIPDEALKHIFDRFYKVDLSRTASRHQGHGLGLSIAKQLVGALHGQISVQKRDTGGVEFLIELPLNSVE